MDDDKRTDKLFQEGADRHDFAYDPDAWTQMEAMLDHDLRRRRWVRLATLLAVILLGGLTFSYFRGELSREEFVPVQQPESPITDQVSSKHDGGNAGYQSSRAGGEAQLDALDHGTEIATVQPGSDGSIVPSEIKSPAPEKIEASTTSFQLAAVSSDEPGDQQTFLTGPTPRRQVTKSLNTSPRLQRLDFTLTTPPASLAIERLTTPAIQHRKIEKSTRESNGGFVVAAGFGRVHGGGGDQNFSQGENRFGLESEYRFGGHFGAKIGGYYGNISFCTEGKDYTAKEGFWDDGVVAKRVEASCRVVEVPLLLSYYLNGNKRDGFFLSGGVTSYFLLKEDFEFIYEDEAHDGVKSWQEVNSNRHLLGFGQFSAGYQQQVGRRTALQVEAYTQLPLTGIGQGRVKLTNIGVTAKLLFDFRK